MVREQGRRIVCSEKRYRIQKDTNVLWHTVRFIGTCNILEIQWRVYEDYSM